MTQCIHQLMLLIIKTLLNYGHADLFTCKRRLGMNEMSSRLYYPDILPASNGICVQDMPEAGDLEKVKRSCA